MWGRTAKMRRLFRAKQLCFMNVHINKNEQAKSTFHRNSIKIKQNLAKMGQEVLPLG
jgi:predicted sulfurtransferase